MFQENSMEVAETLWKVSLAKSGIVDLHFSSVDNGKLGLKHRKSQY